jgi:hypothetical protein
LPSSPANAAAAIRKSTIWMSASPNRTLPHRKILLPATIPHVTTRRALAMIAVRAGIVVTVEVIGEMIEVVIVAEAGVVDALAAVAVVAAAAAEAVVPRHKADAICPLRNTPRRKVIAIPVGVLKIAALTTASPVRLRRQRQHWRTISFCRASHSPSIVPVPFRLPSCP